MSNEHMFDHIKAVIFDVDGTLLDSMWVWRQIDIDFLGKRGLGVPEDLHTAIEGMSYTETAMYFKERFNLEEPIETIKAEWHQMAVEYYKTRIPMKKGARELIECLRKKGIKIGIATSNSKELIEAMMENHQTAAYFDAVRTSCEVPKGKPAPDVYLKVAEDLGVDPSECLAFEDTVAGVTAAKSAGMRVYAVEDDCSAPFREKLEQISEGYIKDFDVMLCRFV